MEQNIFQHNGTKYFFGVMGVGVMGTKTKREWQSEISSVKEPIIFNAGCMGGVEFSNPQFFFVPLHKVTKNFRTHTIFF